MMSAATKDTAANRGATSTSKAFIMTESKAERVRKEESPGRGWCLVVVGGAFAVCRCALHAWLTWAPFYTAGKHGQSSPYDQATGESA